MRKITVDTLHYTERTNGKYRDLRSIEFRLPKRRFARITLNGQYRSDKASKASTRYANPGWAFGTNLVFAEWVHFRRHCFHFALNAFRRGITFSYGKRIV